MIKIYILYSNKMLIIKTYVTIPIIFLSYGSLLTLLKPKYITNHGFISTVLLHILRLQVKLISYYVICYDMDSMHFLYVSM